jgi:hypothetical protein
LMQKKSKNNHDRLWNSVLRRGGAGSGASCHGGQGEARRGKASAWLVGARRLTQGVFGLGVAVLGLAVEVRRVTAWPGLAVAARSGLARSVMGQPHD